MNGDTMIPVPAIRGVLQAARIEFGGHIWPLRDAEVEALIRQMRELAERES